MDFKSFEQTKMSSLPIFKHFAEGEFKISDPKALKGGQKGLYSILRLGLLGVMGYLVWTYVLPPILIAVGGVLSYAAVAATIVMCALLCVPAFKFMKSLARKAHKAVIKSDPFMELEAQRQKMVDNKKRFYESKGTIQGLEQKMKQEASNSEKEAKSMQAKITAMQSKVSVLKKEIGTITNKDSDEYVNTINELERSASESERLMMMYNQANDFAQKYAARGNIMGSLNRKLTRVAGKMDIKILDFDATIQILKNDWEFAKKSREATDAAKKAMGGQKEWELEYALDVVTSTIAADISITQSNLTDIDQLTANFSIDDDALFAKLEDVSNRIESGDEKVVDTKKYNNPNYNLSQDDRNAAGGFDMFK